MENSNNAADLLSTDDLTATLRKLNKGREKGSVSTCKICGHEGSRNHKELNKEGTAHYWCEKNDAVGQLEKLNKILAHKDALIQKDGNDTRARAFNAQRELVIKMLSDAKAEHAAYDPETADKESKSTIRTILAETLALLGGIEASDGITTVALAASVKARVSEVMGNKAEVPAAE